MMNINVDNVVEYLLEKKLIDTKSIVDGDLKAIDISRNSPNIKVIRKRTKSYLLKQLGFITSQVPESHSKEPLFYRLVHSDSSFSFLNGVIPKLYDFDITHKVLIIEFLRNYTSLWDLYLSKHPKYWETDIAAALGTVMGTFHLKFQSILANDSRFAFLSRETPWIFSAHRPGPEILSNLTPEAIQITKIIQNHDMSNELDNLKKDWRIETLIHGDIRWDNVIVSDSVHVDIPRLKLIDWALTDYGDSAWDVAGVLNSYLSFWILNQAPKSQSFTSSTFISEYALSDTWPSIRAFWFAYLKTRKLEPLLMDDLLVRSAKFSAVRLLQSAYELQFSPQFSNQTILMLQASRNIFLKPQDAIIHLFGIPFKL